MLEKSFEQFQNDFLATYGEYKLLHIELNKYRGKEIGDSVEKVNDLILKIQEVYSTMLPAITFIGNRHANIVTVVHEFNKFVEDLKKAGASEITDKHA